MSHWMKRFVVVALVVATAVSVVGVAAAQGPGGRRGGPAGAGMGMRGERWSGARLQLGAYLLDAVMDATGLSLVEVQSAVRDGQSLAEILEANGADPQAVTDSVTAAATAEIDALVEDGRLSEAQAETLKAQLPAALDRMLTADRPMIGAPLRDRIRLRAEDSLVGVLAELAGVDVADLLRDAVQPPTLAEIAEEYGLEADAVIAEAEARLTEEINSHVEAGNLTEEQAAALLEDLHAHLAERFEAPLFGGMRRWIEEWGAAMGRGPHGRMMDGRGRGMMQPFGRGFGWWGESDLDDGSADDGSLVS